MVKTGGGIGCCGDGRYVVRDGSGRIRVYDTKKWTCQSLDEMPDGWSLATGEQLVPIRCSRCYQGWTEWNDAEKRVSDYIREGESFHGYVLGVACLFEKGPGLKVGPPACAGDLDEKHLAKYNRPSECGPSTFQPTPGAFMYGHDVEIGRVLCYWHVHKEDKMYLLAAAGVSSCDADQLIEKYIGDSDSNVSLSLSTYELGREECVAELSVVRVPARRGCFGKYVRSSEELAAVAESLCYDVAGSCDDPEKIRVKQAAFFASTTPGSALPHRERLLESTAHMLKTHGDMLKISKTHPSSNVERYINCGAQEYSELGGHSPPKLLRAGAELSMDATTAKNPETPNMAATDLFPSFNKDAQQLIMSAGIAALAGRNNIATNPFMIPTYSPQIPSYQPPQVAASWQPQPQAVTAPATPPTAPQPSSSQQVDNRYASKIRKLKRKLAAQQQQEASKRSNASNATAPTPTTDEPTTSTHLNEMLNETKQLVQSLKNEFQDFLKPKADTEEIPSANAVAATTSADSVSLEDKITKAVSASLPSIMSQFLKQWKPEQADATAPTANSSTPPANSSTPPSTPAPVPVPPVVQEVPTGKPVTVDASLSLPSKSTPDKGPTVSLFEEMYKLASRKPMSSE